MASDIKWIKITTDMFDDEKIDFISSLPEGDSLIVIWIRLLTMAGKNNAGGYIFLTEKIPFTDDMLAHKFKKPTNIIKLALETFERLGMISFDEAGKIMISNWGKHQNIDGMDKVRELTRIRTAKYRELKASNTNNKDIDKDLDIDIEGDVTRDVTSDATKQIDIKKNKSSFGEFSKVLLTEDEHSKLLDKFGQNGTKERIKRLDEYIASKGVKYKSHYATILMWERKNENQPPVKNNYYQQKAVGQGLPFLGGD